MSRPTRRKQSLQTHDDLLRAEARARRRERGGLRRRLGWWLCGLGLLAFLVGYATSVASIDLLPFDRHHVVLQLGGAVLAAIGVGWATRS